MKCYALAAVGILAFMSTSARAFNGEYCFELYFKSDYANCPGDTNGMKWVPGCTSFFVAPNRTPNKFEVELWDKDTTNSDDFIGTYLLTYSNEENLGVCLQFSWDPVARGEAAPDVFIRTDFLVRGNATAPFKSQACEVDDSASGDSCSDQLSATWRTYAMTDCTNCTEPSVLLFSPDQASFVNRAAMILHSAGVYEAAFDSWSVRSKNTWFWIDGDRCEGACTFSRGRWVSMPFSSIQRWDTPTHETGHSFHVQALQEDNFPGLSCGCIAGDNGCFNPNGHIIDQPSNERCATTEGFANYVHAVSWWSPNNSLSRPTKNGKSIEGGTTTTNSNCSVNSEIELEIARTFWDYDDANNEADMPSPGVGADPVNGTTTTIINGWTNFVDGFGNHQSDEDEDDPEEDWPENALNMQDYVFNVSDGQNFADSMSHNATQCVSTL